MISTLSTVFCLFSFILHLGFLFLQCLFKHIVFQHKPYAHPCLSHRHSPASTKNPPGLNTSMEIESAGASNQQRRFQRSMRPKIGFEQGRKHSSSDAGNPKLGLPLERSTYQKGDDRESPAIAPNTAFSPPPQLDVLRPPPMARRVASSFTAIVPVPKGKTRTRPERCRSAKMEDGTVGYDQCTVIEPRGVGWIE